MPGSETVERALAWAAGEWPGGRPPDLAARPLPVDGSPRLFFRLSGGGRSLILLVGDDNPGENLAWHGLALHLGSLGVPVPGLVAARPREGWFLMEDLGERSLMEAARTAGGTQGLVELYRPVLEILARLQAEGPKGLDTSLCFDGPELTPAFLREREAGYFLREFVQGALGLEDEKLPRRLREDLDAISRRAGEARPRGLVHRDFQSRNLVLDGQGRVGVVDFQGARLGPAQYDLASLLHDPYVDMDWEARERLLRLYLDIRSGRGGLDEEIFRRDWVMVSLSRVMQALGAYAFLSRRRGRPHFAAHVAPALNTLRRLAHEAGQRELPGLAELLETIPREPDRELFRPLPDKE